MIRDYIGKLKEEFPNNIIEEQLELLEEKNMEETYVPEIHLFVDGIEFKKKNLFRDYNIFKKEFIKFLEENNMKDKESKQPEEEKVVNIEEGKIRKGGVNNPPKTERPDPPASRQTESTKGSKGVPQITENTKAQIVNAELVNIVKKFEVGSAIKTNTLINVGGAVVIDKEGHEDKIYIQAMIVPNELSLLCFNKDQLTTALLAPKKMDLAPNGMLIPKAKKENKKEEMNEEGNTKS